MRTSAAPISGTEAMELLLHQVLAGLATGGIYACMALAVVMIYQAIDHLNFAQGEMAMFSTFIAWQLIQWGFPYWIAFGATIVISFAAGVLIERVVLRPIHDAPVLSHVVAFIALLSILNSGAGFLWDWIIKSFTRDEHDAEHPALRLENDRSGGPLWRRLPGVRRLTHVRDQKTRRDMHSGGRARDEVLHCADHHRCDADGNADRTVGPGCGDDG